MANMHQKMYYFVIMLFFVSTHGPMVQEGKYKEQKSSESSKRKRKKQGQFINSFFTAALQEEYRAREDEGEKREENVISLRVKEIKRDPLATLVVLFERGKCTYRRQTGCAIREGDVQVPRLAWLAQELVTKDCFLGLYSTWFPLKFIFC